MQWSTTDYRSCTILVQLLLVSISLYIKKKNCIPQYIRQPELWNSHEYFFSVFIKIWNMDKNYFKTWFFLSMSKKESRKSKKICSITTLLLFTPDSIKISFKYLICSSSWLSRRRHLECQSSTSSRYYSTVLEDNLLNTSNREADWLISYLKYNLNSAQDLSR